MVYAGAGNIAGRMISGVEDRSLMSQHGTLGVQIRKLQDVRYAWPDHSIVVLHSDGLATRWNLKDVGRPAAVRPGGHRRLAAARLHARATTTSRSSS